MQILFASAKIMRERCVSRGLVPDIPHFQTQAEVLAADMRCKSSEEISRLLSCSPEIAELNRRRYALFGTDEAEVMPAVLTYYGQAYRHLKADTLSNEDLLWADGHLWISSCMYGLLRPLDGISTYRMEGGFSLPCTEGRKVNDFWKPMLTDTLIDSVKRDDGVLVYLDTEEFRSLFDWKRVLREIPVIIEPKFHILKNGRLTTPSVWAKTCRGAMARYIIERRLSSPDGLAEFSYEGFRADAGADWSYCRY